MSKSGQKPAYMVIPDKILATILLASHASAEYLHHFLHGFVGPVLRVLCLSRPEDNTRRLERYLAKEIPLTLFFGKVIACPHRGADQDGTGASIPVLLYHFRGRFPFWVEEHGIIESAGRPNIFLPLIADSLDDPFSISTLSSDLIQAHIEHSQIRISFINSHGGDIVYGTPFAVEV